ncbi:MULTISPECIES: ATP-binding protein [Pseudomonas]|uniref:ATP-binding protein n=1 Tax=Pseudomonas asiatica TaxID=2219225 RepID=A0A9X4HX22_9PSED|nr:ATP-binding protein [Pseudomonas asiatica]MDD2109044.1 ATP-binding protein [Pseudomonas asiatica]MDD2112586.1 ATP-binding protein [Pseudomonas asiatica]
MDPIANPYSPGAGAPPPALAGRDALLKQVSIAIARIRRGRAAKSVLMVGLRGVGKTVLLEKMRIEAEAEGVHAIRMEAPENRSLPALLAPQLRLALLRLSRVEAARDLAQRGLRALAGFAKSLKVAYADIEVGLDLEPEPGLADNGDLEGDLATLLEEAGKAAQRADTALVMFIDELQYVAEDQLAALITALHRCAQGQLPVTLVGAGLPQLRGRCGNAKSYAERLFDFPEIGPLAPEAARFAVVRPAEDEGVAFEEAALGSVLAHSQGYPYFLQEWGKHSWDVATQSPITSADVETASEQAIATLDESFFRVRFDRLTLAEKKYLRGMADLGAGPHRSGDIAARLERKVSTLAPLRSALIDKGMIYSPSHGDTAFTVPLFDEFMRRIMPGDDWRIA